MLSCYGNNNINNNNNNSNYNDRCKDNRIINVNEVTSYMIIV